MRWPGLQLDRRRRGLLGLMIALGLGAGTWLRSPALPPGHEVALTLTALPLAPGCCRAGPLRLIGAWQLSSPNETFGGYSALVRPVPGRLLALSDRGYYLDFAQPGAPPGPLAMGPILPDQERFKSNRDVESASYDPASQLLWIGQEGRNALGRHQLPGLTRQTFREVPELRAWPQNSGPEAMVRLTDGRFIVLCECTTGWFHGEQHPAFLFGGDPSTGAAGRKLTFLGGDGYDPTDMAQLPDGRVLVLVRRLRWPVPARFAIKVLLADPAEIAADGTWQASEVADISAPWPVDNYEGLAIERLPDGKLVGWIISDENGAVTQRALLLKVIIDEARLPPKQKAPGSPGRP